MNSLHNFTDYKKAILAQIKANPESKGYKSKLAKVAGMHPSYLTQVLKGDAHLTPDQASLLADFWGFSATEFDYFLTLLHIQRAANHVYRDKLKEKLGQLRRALLKQNDSFQTTDESRNAIRYYSSWLCSAIHMLLLIEGLRTPKQIAAFLGVALHDVERQLLTLGEIGLAVKAGDEWLTTKKNLHSSLHSALAPMHHQNWRQRSIECIKSGRPGFNYTSVYCLGEKDVADIKEKLRALVAEVDRIALAGPSETGACLVLDWFKI